MSIIYKNKQIPGKVHLVLHVAWQSGRLQVFEVARVYHESLVLHDAWFGLLKRG